MMQLRLQALGPSCFTNRTALWAFIPCSDFRLVNHSSTKERHCFRPLRLSSYYQVIIKSSLSALLIAKSSLLGLSTELQLYVYCSLLWKGVIRPLERYPQREFATQNIIQSLISDQC